MWIDEAVPGGPGEWSIRAYSLAPGETTPHLHQMEVDEHARPPNPRLFCLCTSWFRYKRPCSAMLAYVNGSLGRDDD